MWSQKNLLARRTASCRRADSSSRLHVTWGHLVNGLTVPLAHDRKLPGHTSGLATRPNERTGESQLPIIATSGNNDLGAVILSLLVAVTFCKGNQHRHFPLIPEIRLAEFQDKFPFLKPGADEYVQCQECVDNEIHHSESLAPEIEYES